MLQLVAEVADGDGDGDRVVVCGEDLGGNFFRDRGAATGAAAAVFAASFARFLGTFEAMAHEETIAQAAAPASVDVRRAAVEAGVFRVRTGIVALDEAGRAFDAVSEEIGMAAMATIPGMDLVVAAILAAHDLFLWIEFVKSGGGMESNHYPGFTKPAPRLTATGA